MDFLILKKIPLFYGVKPEEIPSILHCLSGQIRSFSKGEMIFCAGESITSVGIVLEGSVHIEIDDFWGSKNILNHVRPGQLFGEAYACSPFGTADGQCRIRHTQSDFISGCSKDFAYL